jgi:thiamine pyrophosphokinase
MDVPRKLDFLPLPGRKFTFKMRSIIFANGQRSLTKCIMSVLRSDDFLIAADGGARLALACGLTPHLLVGDMDSLTPTELAAFRSAGSKVDMYPPRKDFTDLELALQQAVTHNCDEAVIVGGLGARWDQTIANLLLPVAFPSMKVRLIDGLQEITVISAGKAHTIQGEPGDTVSLIPVGGDAAGVSTSGLEYPLHAEKLRLGTTRGVSNVLIAREAQVTLEHGRLMCVVIHQQKNPE